MRRILRALLALLLLVPIAACAYGSSSGNNNPQPAPSSNNNSDCGYTWNPCGGSSSPPAPVQSADAAPIWPGQCKLYLVPNDGTGISVKNALQIHGQFYVSCNRRPVIMLVTARLESKNSAGNWVDEADILVDPRLPSQIGPNNYRRDYEVVATCYPGEWRMEISWSGIKADGKTHFPNPADGDGPGDRTTDVHTTRC